MLKEEQNLAELIPPDEAEEITPEEIQQKEEELDASFKATANVRVFDIVSNIKALVKNNTAKELTKITVEQFLSEAEQLGKSYFTRKVLIHRSALFNIAMREAQKGKQWAFEWLVSQIDGTKASIRKTKIAATFKDVVDSY